MSRVYSARLLAHSLLDGTDSVVVPPAETWVVRDVELVQGDLAVAGEAFLSTGSIQWLWVRFANSGTEHAQWQGRVVLEPGDVLFARTNTPIDVYVSGYKLT